MLSDYRESVKGVYGIDETYLEGVPEISVDRAVKFAVINTILPGTLALLLFPAFRQNTLTMLASYVTPVMWAVWNGLVAHGLIVLMGGEKFERTLNLYLVLTAFYLTLWIPVVNMFVLFYGMIATERGLEEVHDLDFYRSIAVTVLTPVLSVLLFAVLLV